MFTQKKFDGLFEVAKIAGVPVFVHWSVFAVALLMLTGAVKNPIMSVVAMASYIGILVIHEWGHSFAAKLKHCEVYSIKLYPLHGLCTFQQPWNKRDH